MKLNKVLLAGILAVSSFSAFTVKAEESAWTNEKELEAAIKLMNEYTNLKEQVSKSQINQWLDGFKDVPVLLEARIKALNGVKEKTEALSAKLDEAKSKLMHALIAAEKKSTPGITFADAKAAAEQEVKRLETEEVGAKEDTKELQDLANAFKTAKTNLDAKENERVKVSLGVEENKAQLVEAILATVNASLPENKKLEELNDKTAKDVEAYLAWEKNEATTKNAQLGRVSVATLAKQVEAALNAPSVLAGVKALYAISNNSVKAEQGKALRERINWLVYDMSKQTATEKVIRSLEKKLNTEEVLAPRTNPSAEVKTVGSSKAAVNTAVNVK